MNKLMGVVFTGLALFTYQQKSADWKDLAPLVTTRAQLEAVWGRPTSGNGNTFVYETPAEKLHVSYGGGKSLGADVCCWKLSTETLFKLEWVPKRALALSAIKIDLAGFQKQKAPEMTDDYYYYNDNEGMTITTRIVGKEEVVLSIEKGPNAAQREKACREKNC